MATPAPAVIVNTETDDSIPVMYNPEEYRIEQGNSFAEIGIPGQQSPPLQFVRGKARSLTMELVFDTNAEGNSDVRDHVDRILALLQKTQRTKAPPVLRFAMGRFRMDCVLVDVAQRYTMFRADGTPVRAILSVRFQEHVKLDVQVRRGLFVGPPLLHRIVGGETLSSVAAEYLGDASRWREIADANGIADPLALIPGASLVIPGGSG
jgi:nucleoid-associated protein YgaU